MSASEAQLRADIVEVGRRLYARGYTASNDGNISVRLDAGRLLMTPTSVCKGFMTPEMMCITDLDGRKLAGERDPSSEMQMHLEVYRQRPDVQAVVHAHPPTATGFAVAGIPLDPRRARRGRHDAREHSDCRVRDAVHDGAARGRPQVREGARRHAAGQPRRAGAGRRTCSARTTRWRRSSTSRRSASSRGCSAASSCCRARRWSASRGCADHYGITAPAPICPEPTQADQAECQVIEAPVVPGRQLVDAERLAGPGSSRSARGPTRNADRTRKFG